MDVFNFVYIARIRVRLNNIRNGKKLVKKKIEERRRERERERERERKDDDDAANPASTQNTTRCEKDNKISFPMAVQTVTHRLVVIRFQPILHNAWLRPICSSTELHFITFVLIPPNYNEHTDKNVRGFFDSKL